MRAKRRQTDRPNEEAIKLPEKPKTTMSQRSGAMQQVSGVGSSIDRGPLSIRRREEQETRRNTLRAEEK